MDALVVYRANEFVTPQPTALLLSFLPILLGLLVTESG